MVNSTPTSSSTGPAPTPNENPAADRDRLSFRPTAASGEPALSEVEGNLHLHFRSFCRHNPTPWSLSPQSLSPSSHQAVNLEPASSHESRHRRHSHSMDQGGPPSGFPRRRAPYERRGDCDCLQFASGHLAHPVAP